MPFCYRLAYGILVHSCRQRTVNVDRDFVPSDGKCRCQDVLDPLNAARRPLPLCQRCPGLSTPRLSSRRSDRVARISTRSFTSPSVSCGVGTKSGGPSPQFVTLRPDLGVALQAPARRAASTGLYHASLFRFPQQGRHQSPLIHRVPDYIWSASSNVA